MRVVDIRLESREVTQRGSSCSASYGENSLALVDRSNARSFHLVTTNQGSEDYNSGTNWHRQVNKSPSRFYVEFYAVLRE